MVESLITASVPLPVMLTAIAPATATARDWLGLAARVIAAEPAAVVMSASEIARTTKVGAVCAIVTVADSTRAVVLMSVRFTAALPAPDRPKVGGVGAAGFVLVAFERDRVG